VAALVRRLLEGEGFAVDATASGEDGLALALARPYDAVVLDLGLPDRAGLTVVEELRARQCTTPVLILTGSAAAGDDVAGLDVGADDYLAKPFANAVLTARVRALVRRGATGRFALLRCGALLIDRLARHASVAGRAIRLTPIEFRLLEQLALHGGAPVSRVSLLRHVWGLGFDPGTNIAEVTVLRLRRKLAAAGPGPHVVAVRGSGYALVGGPTPPADGAAAEGA
jgi:two-component system, OmpR family, response regulator